MRRDCPRRLYKYFASDRWGFFSDLRVRYSQLGAFNDPFEGRPEITALATRGDVLSSVKLIAPDVAESVLQKLPGYVRATITYAQVSALAEAILQQQQPQLLDAMESIAPHAAALLIGGIDKHLGVMCLSEVPDSLLMWAHYASQHEGFVVEFDARHACFHQQKSESDDLRHIRRVHYRESRPSAPLSEIGAVELFLAKSGHWDYEREWRIVRPLADADAVISAAGPYPVHLFGVPGDAVTGVLLGARMAKETAARIRNAIQANESIAKVRVQRAVASAHHFLLEFKDVP